MAREKRDSHACEMQLGFDFDAPVFEEAMPSSSTVLRTPWSRLRDDSCLTAAERLEANAKAVSLLATLASRTSNALSDDEKAILEGYSGYVPAHAARYLQAELSSQVRQLVGFNSSLLRDEALLSSYYTPTVLASAMWDAVLRLGFTGGRILEPCAGNGVFLATMPHEVFTKSQVHAGDADEIAARLIKARFEGLTFHEGLFEEVRLPDGYFDLVITNVPFGNVRVGSKDVASERFSLHDYFIAKALKKTRPGGLVAVITSHGTMDKSGQAARKFFDTYARLIDAWRLPSCAFEEVEATVVTDVLFFQRKADLHSSQSRWVETSVAQYPNLSDEKPEPIIVNQYFTDNPERVLGRAVTTNGRFGRELKVIGDMPNGEQLNALVKSLPQLAVTKATLGEQGADNARIASSANTEGELLLIDEKLFVVENGLLAPLVCSTRRAQERIKGMVLLKAAVRDLLDKQVCTNATDQEVAEARERLNLAYDQFILEHGHVSLRANQLVFEDEPSYPLLLALEVYDEEAESFTKAPIFTERTTWPRAIQGKAKNLSEAIRLATKSSQTINLDEAARRLEITAEALTQALSVGDEAYLDPTSRQYVPRDAYLSGDVLTKLELAECAAAYEAAFERNVTALRQVLPARIKANDIYIRLSSPWLLKTWIDQFAHAMIGSSVRIEHDQTLRSWTVGYSRGVMDKAQDPTLNAPRKPFSKLLEHALNQTVPKVYDTVDGNQVLNREQTMNAQSVLQEVQKRFRAWLFEETSRALAVEDAYNERCNRYVKRTHQPLEVPIEGLSSARTPRSSQLRALSRGLAGANMLLAHKVGFGKTLILCALAMLYRQQGYAKKPMLVVKNSTLMQFTAEFVRLFPSARILMMSKDDLSRERRKQWTAKVAMGDWDAVIVPHSVFDRIRVSADTVATYLDTQCEALDAAILATPGSSARRLVQRRQALRASLSASVELAQRDDHISFEELGVDTLLVDEADAYKNLGVTTRMEVKGVATTQSARAVQMLLKIQHIFKVQGAERGVVFSTATPISNSVVEAFTMMRYLQPGVLAQLGLTEFDAWAATFGEVVLAGEVAPDGGSFRVTERFAKFHNLPELLAITEQVWDLVDPTQIDIKRPAECHHKVSVAPSKRLKAFVASCVERAAIVQRRQVDPKEDNMLKVVTDGRKAALDMRLIKGGPGDPQNKITHAADEIFKRWSKPPIERATQLVFCDLSTPSQSWNVYAALKEALIAKGIPETEIAFVQSFTTDKAKADLFRRVNAGSIRVLMGSTEVLGVGVNVQRRLCAIHELDAPWRPRDVEQRLGRGVRQGNLNESVDIVRYVTEGSFDAYLWQTLERKSAYIEAFMRGQLSVRSIEDVSEVTLSFGELKAIACGNPLVRDKAMADFELARVASLHREYETKRSYAKNAVDLKQREIADCMRLVDALQADLTQWRADSKYEWKFSRVSDKPDYPLGRAVMDALKFVKAAAHGGHQVDPQRIAAKGDFVLRAHATDEAILQLQRTAVLSDGVALNSSYASVEELLTNDGVEQWMKSAIDRTTSRAQFTRDTLAEAQHTLASPNPYDEALAKATIRSDELRERLEALDKLEPSAETEPALKAAA